LAQGRELRFTTVQSRAKLAVLGNFGSDPHIKVRLIELITRAFVTLRPLRS